MSSSSAATNPSFLRRYRVPLIAIAVPSVLFVLTKLWMAYEWAPEALFPLYSATTWSMPLAVIVLACWWLFFSGFRLATRLTVLAVAVAIPFGFAQLVQRVDFTGSMTPRFWFIWEADPVAAFEKHVAAGPAAAAELTPISLTIGPDDFPRYRGPNCDGVVATSGLAPEWASVPLKTLWRQPCGGGYAGFAVAGNVAITIEQRKQEEAIICYDRGTGKQRWQFTYPALFEQTAPMGGNGPRATPTIADGDVYSLGATGELVCIDGATGAKRWQVNIISDNGAKVLYWGMSGSPLLVGSNVIVNAGIHPDKNIGQAVAAYDRKTGKKVWATGDRPAGYSSPQLAKLAGVEQILLFDGTGLVSLDPTDGKENWRHDWKTFGDMNIVQPLVLSGDRVFISSEAANGGVMLKIARDAGGWKNTVLWQNRKMYARFASPVSHRGHLFGLCNGFLTCVKEQDGERAWKDGTFGSGQVLLVGDVLVIGSEEGEIVTVAADPAEYRELGRREAVKGRTWNTPALAGRQLFVRNHYEMTCLELAER